MLRFALGVLVLVGILLPLTGPLASAHVGPTYGRSTIRQDGSLVRYTLEIAYERLTPAAGLGQVTPGAEDPERIAFLEAGRAQLASFVADRVIVERDGARCAPELEGTQLAWQQGYPFARMFFVYRCPESAGGEFTVRYGGMISEETGVGGNHTSVVDYELGGRKGRDVFNAGHNELRVGGADAGAGHHQPQPGDPGRGESQAAETGFFSSMARFIGLGIEHILTGIDHVLFLVLLLLGAQGWRSVVKLATSFTVAHSVTLALAALGWIEVPSAIVEPLIALSIVYVAVENLMRRSESRYRVLVVFGFGLLHGLGFAGALNFAEEAGGRLVSSLFSFNVGIELGQLAIVLLVFPLLLLARRYSWSAIVHTGAATVVAGIGLFWLVERVVAASSGAS